MKKFIYASCIVILIFFGWNIAYYRLGVYIDLHPNQPVTTIMKTDAEKIYMERDGEYEPFEIRGVNMGVGIPGKWATDYAIDAETYQRWFGWIQEMGANTIRVYTILQDDFYNAFYEYNTQREEQGEEPLWLIHGVWVNDYIQNSHRDAFDDEFRETLLKDCRTLLDILHGKKNLNLGYGIGSGSYRSDVSPWVIGYILGVEWEDVTVTYTNHKNPDRNSFQGKYMYTTEDATPFEAMLCEVGNHVIEYESERYKQQKLIAFSNWPTADPFDYPENITRYFRKCAKVDVEHIKTTEEFLSGCFASYHVYPYYPDYLNYLHVEIEEKKANHPNFGYSMAEIMQPLNPIEQYLPPEGTSRFLDERGQVNTYYTYLKALTKYHTIPVVITEYGVSTGRGMAQRDYNTGRNQGNMSEADQGRAIIECYEDIRAAGCAGGCIFTWQDEWFKRTWNTMHAVDLLHTPFWSDYQTNEQYFGLLAFDPGEEQSICYVDGDLSEWKEEDLVVSNGEVSVSMKYDEKFLYFRIHKDGFASDQSKIYIPLDISPKIGSTYCENYDLSFERACDFLIVIDGRENSRVMVQERNEVLRAMYNREVNDIDPYQEPVDADTPVFKQIHLILQTAMELITYGVSVRAETYETGLLKYGNASPSSDEFDSLADFIFSGDDIELKLPWQLLNFSNPSEMKIHDDYYEHYGIENIQIDRMYVGATDEDSAEHRIKMNDFPLKGWERNVTYHERLKQSYYDVKEYWNTHEMNAE